MRLNIRAASQRFRLSHFVFKAWQCGDIESLDMLAWKEGLGGGARTQLEGRTTARRLKCSLSNISSDCFWIIRALCEQHKTTNQPGRGKHIFSSHSTAISMGGSNFMKSTRLRHPSPVGQEQNSFFHLTPQISQKRWSLCCCCSFTVKCCGVQTRPMTLPAQLLTRTVSFNSAYQAFASEEHVR